MGFGVGSVSIQTPQISYQSLGKLFITSVFSSVKLNVTIDKIADFLRRLNEIMYVKILILINFEAIMKLNQNHKPKFIF